MEPKRVIVKETLIGKYYMDSDWRLYDMKTKEFYAMFDEYTDSIDYEHVMANIPNLYNFIIIDEDMFYEHNIK